MAVRLQWMRRHSFLPVNIAWLWMLFDSPMDEDSPLLTKNLLLTEFRLICSDAIFHFMAFVEGTMNHTQNEIVVDAEILLLVADNEAQILLASSSLTILGPRFTSGIT